MDDPYRTRKLAAGYPGLDKLAHEAFEATLTRRPDDTRRLERLMLYLGRLIDLHEGASILVLGCGPRPQGVDILRKRGFDVVGVEPVPSFVEAAGDYLGSKSAVLLGAAEDIPLPDSSRHLVLFESVLEHVDSTPDSLAEIFRVLVPGGAAYVTTTNRRRFSPSGRNGEFNVRFFPWLPALLKESFVFHHLHYEPSLANYTERPAVHWFSYADLCRLGRAAGFSRFYSPLDLLRAEDEAVKKSALRRLALRRLQRSPWLRALALTQLGDTIIMLKPGT